MNSPVPQAEQIELPWIDDTVPTAHGAQPEPPGNCLNWPEGHKLQATLPFVSTYWPGTQGLQTA